MLGHYFHCFFGNLKFFVSGNDEDFDATFRRVNGEGVFLILAGVKLNIEMFEIFTSPLTNIPCIFSNTSCKYETVESIEANGEGADVFCEAIAENFESAGGARVFSSTIGCDQAADIGA